MKYSLDFLAWCNRCLYKDDFWKELEELGIPFQIRYNFHSSGIWEKHCCVLGLYQNFIRNKECIDALEKWIEMMHKKWETY